MDLQSLGVGSEGSFLKEGPMSRARVGKEGGGTMLLETKTKKKLRGRRASPGEALHGK